VAEKEAHAIVLTVRGEIEQAADTILSAAEQCLKDAGAAREGESGAFDRLEQSLCAILEACAFQDITGQRLTKLHTMLDTLSVKGVDADPLLNGPALSGEGLDQGAADRLMATR
tara:strand:- start:73020 stop:73361 length:342 start_codon:yes stop_codon:yes gene_type:complete